MVTPLQRRLRWLAATSALTLLAAPGVSAQDLAASQWAHLRQPQPLYPERMKDLAAPEPETLVDIALQTPPVPVPPPAPEANAARLPTRKHEADTAVTPVQARALSPAQVLPLPGAQPPPAAPPDFAALVTMEMQTEAPLNPRLHPLPRKVYDASRQRRLKRAEADALAALAPAAGDAQPVPKPAAPPPADIPGEATEPPAPHTKALSVPPLFLSAVPETAPEKAEGEPAEIIPAPPEPVNAAPAGPEAEELSESSASPDPDPFALPSLEPLTALTDMEEPENAEAAPPSAQAEAAPETPVNAEEEPAREPAEKEIAEKEIKKIKTIEDPAPARPMPLFGPPPPKTAPAEAIEIELANTNTQAPAEPEAEAAPEVVTPADSAPAEASAQAEADMPAEPADGPVEIQLAGDTPGIRLFSPPAAIKPKQPPHEPEAPEIAEAEPVPPEQMIGPKLPPSLPAQTQADPAEPETPDVTTAADAKAKAKPEPKQTAAAEPDIPIEDVLIEPPAREPSQPAATRPPDFIRAAPVIPVARGTLSPQTRRILSRVPHGVDSPPPVTRTHAEISRFDPDIEGILNEEGATGEEEDVATHESLGVSIEVRRPLLDISTELQYAYDALLGGQPQVAIQIYKNILRQAPRNEDALFGIATTFHRLGDIGLARPFYGKLLAINPKHRDGLTNFMTLVAQESPEDAVRQLESLAAANPDFSPIPAQLGILYDRMGYQSRAIDALIRAVRLAPDNVAYKYNLAVLFDKYGKISDATVLYNQLLAAGRQGASLPAEADEIQRRVIFINDKERQG